ncbi:hypothetical protein VLK31_11370 [Variovorax sp. H27-G14]|uniref:hypothetical protein n=1 Tax=Variovorax sp. H27-G14 TaxID=3111914 RepID=UPI0038FD3045
MNPRTMGSLTPGNSNSSELGTIVAPSATNIAIALTPDIWNEKVVIPPDLNSTLLASEQSSAIIAQVKSVSIRTLTLTDISALGAECETALHKSLGAFLDRIDQSESPAVFRLVASLDTAIRAENLDGLADKIIQGDIGLLNRLLGALSPRKLTAARSAAFENLRMLVAGKARKLSAVIETMEKQVEAERAKAIDEAKNLERLKENYRLRFFELASATVFLATLLAKARQELAEIAAEQSNGAQGTHRALGGQITLQEAQDKVQALESRALAVEGVFTKLPAEQLVIRQIQAAAIQTVQEVTTTTAGRFASIKMALLTLHAAMQVQSLQRTAQQGADLDLNLSRVRDRLSKQVVGSAAHAPGDNRLAQAQQIKAATQNIGELVEIVEKARADNTAKFAQARATLAQARADLTTLGAVIRPDRPFKS